MGWLLLELLLSVHLPLSAEGWVEPPTKFSKRGGGVLERALIFRGGLVRKRRWPFQEGVGGGCSFYIKDKLKS